MEFWLYDHSTNERKTLHVDASAITLGRDDDCTITLKSPFVARKHARILQKGNQFFVETLCHSGTRVTNREVQPGTQVKLDFGDELQLGQYSLAPVGRESEQAVDHVAQRQAQLMAFEQQIHADLLDRMNLRVTGHLNKSDANFVSHILQHLEALLATGVTQLDPAVIEHTARGHLHRRVIAEVVRQCQGKVQTDYRTGDESLLDDAKEQQITQWVASMVDMMPLLFDPTSVTEDLAVAEDEFDKLFAQEWPSVSKALAHYMVRRTVSKDIQDILLGLGPLQDLLDMPSVSEIMVVGSQRIYIEKNGVILPTTRTFFSDDILMSIIERILAPVGRRVDTSSPLVDARLEDGSRVNVIIEPLSLAGPCLTIRKFGWMPFTMDDLLERGTLTPQAARFLQGCLIGRQNMVISGGTASGKTTLLNVLGGYARPAERIVTIEESAELKLPQPHVVALEGRPANVEGQGAFTIRELVRNALRMRPDRIIVGEVRGAEALDMLQAMNTGHDGSLSTLHANTPIDAAKRLETLVLMGVDMPIRAVREQIVSAVDLVVQVARFAAGGRYITHISEVVGIDEDTGEVLIEDIYRLAHRDEPTLRHTGYIPTFAQRMIDQQHFGVEVFL